jgi:hypothetical protein
MSVSVFSYQWTLTDLNRRPLACEASALPAELRAQKAYLISIPQN